MMFDLAGSHRMDAGIRDINAPSEYMPGNEDGPHRTRELVSQSKVAGSWRAYSTHALMCRCRQFRHPVLGFPL